VLRRGALVGGVYLCDKNEFGDEPSFGQLHYPFVASSERGKGIYSILFAQLVERARLWGLDGVPKVGRRRREEDAPTNDPPGHRARPATALGKTTEARCYGRLATLCGTSLRLGNDSLPEENGDSVIGTRQ
jgi:hypothetical protein